MGVLQIMKDQTKSIPGNIKSWYIPFMLNKYGPSFYSFKNQCNLPIGICPNSFDQMIKGDVGYKMIGSFDNSKAQANRKNEIDINTIFDQIPSIRIREVQQDSKMQDIASAMKIISDGFEIGVDVAKSLFQGNLKATGKALISTSDELLDALVDPANKESGLKSKYIGDTYDQIILNWPYGLYYNLIGSTTTNVYELPCNYTELHRDINANGWNYQEDDSFGFGGINTSSLIGKAISFLGSNFSIKLQPRWKASDTSPQTVTITVNLFNDTLDHAVANYIMVNNLIANSMSLQYGLYKHAPAYYDVKIAGFTRMFMCKGTINVSHAGQTRTPNVDFYKKLEIYKNTYYQYEQKEFIDNQWIKIPDVYKLQLTFESLLPQNLNNYVYQFSKNEIKMYENGRQEGYMSQVEGKLDSFAEKLEQYIKDQKQPDDSGKPAEEKH